MVEAGLKPASTIPLILDSFTFSFVRHLESSKLSFILNV